MDTTPAASPRPSPPLSQRTLDLLPLHSTTHNHHPPLASPRATTPTPRLTPASYPCPPLYRNKRRLPHVQQQWYTQTLRSQYARTHTALPWEDANNPVKELRADWGLTVGQVVKRMCKVDGVHVTKGVVGGRKTERLRDGGDEKQQALMGGVKEKSGVDDGGLVDSEQASIWNTQSLLIRVESAAGEEKQQSEEKEARDERSDEEDEDEDDEKRMQAATPSGSADSPIRPARSAFLSPTRQRRVSEEEEERQTHPTNQPLHSPLASPSPSSSSSSNSANPSTRRFSFVPSTPTSPPTAAQRQWT